MDAAFKAAARALPGLADDAKQALAKEQVGWADAFPGSGDPVALRKVLAELSPDDGTALEDWLAALERAGRLAGWSGLPVLTVDSPAVIVHNQRCVRSVVTRAARRALGRTLGAEAAQFPHQLEVPIVVGDGLRVGHFLGVV